MTFDFDQQISRLNTHSYKWDLLGEEYIPLWVADTDFAVPPAVTERLKKRIEHPFYGYFLTGNEIYNVLSDWFMREYQVKVPGKKWIRLVNGIVPGLAVASHIGGGKSLTNVPNYCNLLTAPENVGNEMITVPLRNEDEVYSIDFDALQAAVTSDTKLFYLCNPHNPVGRVFSLEELKEVSAFAKKNNLIVISDEAHCEVVYEGKHIPFFTVDDYAREHSITFYSNGKMYNTADVILAFAVIPNDKLRDEFEKYAFPMGEEHTLNVEVGIATYGESAEWQKQMLSYLKDNRDYLESELKRRFPKVKLTHLEATFLQWADFRAYGECVDAEFFRKKAKVFLTDGKDFGQEGYVRINFATQRAVLTAALDRMEEAIKENES